MKYAVTAIVIAIGCLGGWLVGDALRHPRKCVKYEEVLVTKCIDTSRGPADKYCNGTFTRPESICVEYVRE